MFERRHRDEDGDRIHGQNRHLHDDREHQPNRNRNHDRRPGILINNVVVRPDPNKNKNNDGAITTRASRAAQDKLDRVKSSLEDLQARLRDKAREARVLQDKVDRAQEDVVRARRERDLLCVADEKEKQEREKQEKRRREREREREREERARQDGRGRGHGHAKGRGMGVRVERMERVEVERKMYWRFSD
ncbi:hypothetical protein LTR67_007779 [Exophiala xenobiotica]|jgi:hypothetical protein